MTTQPQMDPLTPSACTCPKGPSVRFFAEPKGSQQHNVAVVLHDLVACGLSSVRLPRPHWMGHDEWLRRIEAAKTELVHGIGWG